MKRIVGQTGPVPNEERISYSPQEGWSYAGTIEGPKAGVKPLLYQLAQLGYSFEYSSEQSPKGVVHWDSSGDPGGAGGSEQPTAVWEFFGNRIEIDLLEADLNGSNGTGDLNSISEADKRKIRDAIAAPDPDAAPALTGVALQTYQLMLGGVRSFRIHVPTLKVSRLVSNRYQVIGSQSNIGRIITTATLEVQELFPARHFVLPSTTSTKTGFSAGWYKNHPNVQQAGGGKWTIAQEWEYNLWATLIHGTAL